MKKLFFITLVCWSAQIYAQSLPSCTVRKNSKGIWEVRSTLSRYDQKTQQSVDSVYWQELSYGDRGGGDTVYHITYNSNLQFRLENGEYVTLNVFSKKTQKEGEEWANNTPKIESSHLSGSAFGLPNSNSDDPDKGFNKKNCTFNGIPLHGNVKIVESFADIKVQIVNSFPDLNVKVVESFPDDCGEWKLVESFPDFTIQIVTSFPDIKIKYVESFPGVY